MEADPESLETPVENAPVLSMKYGNITIEGYSRAAVQTYWRVPEWKIGFDLGLQPWSFMSTPNWFVSHGHLDHIAALPALVTRRRMMKMEPPTIYMPEELIDGVEMLLRAVQRLDRGRAPANLVGLRPGDVVDVSRELAVSCFPTDHRIESLGFIVWEKRKKLKPEFTHLDGNQIRDLRLSGVEVSQEFRMPRLAFTGDTAPKGLDVEPALYRAEILICEATFVTKHERPSESHKFGHTHLEDILARASLFQNQLIILSHFSTRQHADTIRKIVEKSLPESLRDRVRIWL
jgi:ribonuclease Z